MRRSWPAWCCHHSGGLLHVAGGVKQNIATGGESVGGRVWGRNLICVNLLEGRGGGIYELQFVYERIRLERMKKIRRWYE